MGDAIMWTQDDNSADNKTKNQTKNDNDTAFIYDDDANVNDDDNKAQPLIISNNDNNQKSNSAQYKFVWQWPENDGSWHDYDATTQLLLDQLSIGQSITISAGKWTYAITKTSNNSCSQTNVQTQNVRTCRKAKILISAPVIIQQQGKNNWLGSGRYVFIWQFLENDSLWKDLGFDIATKLEQLAINHSVQYSFGKWSYNVTKISADECTQCNESTNNQRDLRRIWYDVKLKKRIVWQFEDKKKKNGWCCVDSNALNMQLYKLQSGQSINHQRGQWKYCITKIDESNASQKNVITNTKRAYRLSLKDKNQMDANWTSKAQTSNQNNVAAYNATFKSVNSSRYALYRNLMAAQNEEDKTENVVLDPNDIQNVAMDDNKNENDGVDDEVETIKMSEDERNILNEFEKTLSRQCVQVLGIQKIKDNASKSMVYAALLNEKCKELAQKSIESVERVLFHGTSFSNIAKIVNNGFNCDFNCHHLYGKGTYFSSMASESAKYCINDDEDDKDKFVMLICKVIIGEYTLGTQQMDGASIPYKADKKTQYESCVNDVKKPTIFVINRDYHAIPTHIITFKYIK